MSTQRFSWLGPLLRTLLAVALGAGVTTLYFLYLRGPGPPGVVRGPGSALGRTAAAKYASGATIKQVLKRPVGTLRVPAGAVPGLPLPTKAVRDFLTEQDDLGTRKIDLVLHYQATRKTKLEDGKTRQTGYYEFGFTYRGRPIAKASRALTLVDDVPVLVVDRNVPSDPEKFGETDETVPNEDARELATRDARATDAVRKKEHVVLGDATSPRLVIWVDKEGAGRLCWEMSVRSFTRGTPFLRRYWVAARDKPEIVSYEDLVFGAAPPGRPRTVQPIPLGLTLDAFALGRSDRLAAARLALQGEKRDAPPRMVPEAVGTRGRVTGPVWGGSSFRAVWTNQPLRNVRVTLTAGERNETTATNEDGEYVFPGVEGEVQVTAALTGPYAGVHHDFDTSSGAGPNLAVTRRGRDTIDLDFQSVEKVADEVAQVSAFHWTNAARDFVLRGSSLLPQQLFRATVSVNISGSLLANYYTPRVSNDGPVHPKRKPEMVFARGEEIYPNAASRHCVIHEYGHLIDDEMGGMKDKSYSEGFADALVILMTRQSIALPDFLGKDKHLRDANAPKKVLWPEVENAEGDQGIYDRGSAYAGFAWELIQQLEARYKGPGGKVMAYTVAARLIILAAEWNPKCVPDAVALSFRADQYLYPGTPGMKSKHFDELARAADLRGLPRPKGPLTGP